MSGPESNNPGQTVLRRIEQYNDRWTSYGANTGIRALSERPTPDILKKYEVFADFDDAFLESISPDISIANWKPGQILFEEGNYIDIAFYVIEGRVDIYLQLAEGAPPPPIFDSSRTLMMAPPAAKTNAPAPDDAGQTMFQAQVDRQAPDGARIDFLTALDFDLPGGGALSLGSGEFFGEIGALSGWPQSATARTGSECILVQIRTAALRKMRKESNALKQKLDSIYRKRSLSTQLKATPLFRDSGCDDAFIEELSQKVELVSCDPNDVITKEREPADAMYIVRSGFIKLSQKFGESNVVVSYLSKGSTLGEAELLMGEIGQWLYTSSSKAYAELVKIPRAELLDIISKYPEVEERLWNTVVSRTKEVGQSRRNIRQSEFIETALDKGLVEGNAILAIDLNVCTRCDECVRACAETHDGIPRFVREGDKFENFLITRSCYHCQDPLCLVGCPTGAIRRAGVGDVVAINPDVCIGCRSCAKNCPYDAIMMHDTGTVWPDDMVPEGLRGRDRKLATKCDLCYTNPAGPACVRNCPNACAFRVGSLDEFKDMLAKRT